MSVPSRGCDVIGGGIIPCLTTTLWFGVCAMLCRYLTTSVAGLLLAASFAGAARPNWAPAGEPAKSLPHQRITLLQAVSGKIAVNVPITITLPADYEPYYDKDGSYNSTFWATREDLRAAFQHGGFTTRELKRGAFWFSLSPNVGYDVRTGKFLEEESPEDCAKALGVTNVKITHKTVNGRAIRTITGNDGNRFIYGLYVWTGIDTSCILVTYHHPEGKHTPEDDEIWAQFVDGLGQPDGKPHQTGLRAIPDRSQDCAQRRALSSPFQHGSGLQFLDLG